MFDIKETDIYKIFTIFGIKITLKKKTEKADIDKIVWWIPNKKLRNSIRNIYYNFNGKINDLNNKINDINFKINNINDIIFNYTDNYINLLLKPEWEVHWISKFKNIINTDYYELYKELIKSLDDESINTVNSILAKIKLYNNNPNIPATDLFLSEEISTINNIYKRFFGKIIKFNDYCYAYNKYFIPVSHFELSVFYYKHEIDKLDTQFIKNNNIIDVGGFVGDSAIVFSDYTNKNVYTFEPVKENFNNILKTIELNEINNIIPINKALGKETNNQNIYASGSASNLKEEPFDKNYINEEIEIIKLDDFVNENNIKIGLIKVDTEGAEKDFLLGARRTIEDQIPILLISIYHSPEDFFGLKPMLESWNLNYKFRVYKPLDGQIVQETLLIAEPDQTRPDQTRPDQTRPNYCICIDYIYVYNNSKYKKIQPMLQHKIAA
ncbi:FkbM family methyltransferase [Brachyspira murdochii]|uniref:FkbM family methyltransferase n=1 Tax=Brachyspira murdochii TaxID=84378 RepID=UPI0012F49E56|nr:FkbM family methyltransferase [Brachyspira murdochii]